jgi:AcrR family transcriptional regulator
MNSDSPSRSGVQPRLRDRLREATTNEILAAANQLFTERGVERTSMADIAARAGLAVGTLYNHFRDREALLNTLLDNHQSELLRDLDAQLAECAGQPFIDQLRTVLQRFFASFERKLPLFEALLQSDKFCTSTAQKFQALSEIYKRFEVLAARGLATGALKVELAPLVPSLLFGVARTVMVAPFIAGLPKMQPSDVELLLSFFLHGVGVEK